MPRQPDLIVFSHLRWDFVWQRPQHLLTHLTADRRIFFIEEPVHTNKKRASWEHRCPTPNVAVYRPLSPCPACGFHDDQIPILRPLLRRLLAKEKVSPSPVVWFYTPMALPLLQEIQPGAIVYDCMDELSAFRFAPPQLIQREAELLRLADVVFTGGPSLYRARKDRHPNIHCFPSSVDATHFGQARKQLPEPADQAKLPHPRLGFFGVIDERFDIPILDHLAVEQPDWQLVMLGPVVKIDPATLPKHPNILYTGLKTYQELPPYLSGWDVCLLPFARNEATQFISPTKTLEYMAAEKPIVSTPITDVAKPYGDIVYLGASPEEFLVACQRALAAPAKEKEARIAAMREVVANTSWDRTVASMSQLIDEACQGKPEGAAPGKKRSRQKQQSPPVVVVGAGPTGLSAAYHLGSDALLLEQNERVGGFCRSIKQDGFTFDFAGHIMFSNDPYVHQMYRMLLGDNVHWQDREAWVFSHGVYTRYPFQGALCGLPADVIKECLVGAIEARFGSLEQAKAPSSNGHNGHAGNSCKSVQDCCGDGIMESTAKLRPGNGAAPSNFEEFIYRVWGAGIARHFAIPYNRKLWGVPLTEMETSWLGGRVPMPDLAEMIEGALQPVPRPMGPNARFGYPLRGGFQALMDGFLPHLRGPRWLDTRVSGVSAVRKRLTLNDGREIPYEQLINTMPLPVLIRLMGDEVPSEVRRAAAALRSISVRCVHLGIGREQVSDKHWIYYPGETVFHRIFVQGNASPHCNAPGGFGLTCEITWCPRNKPLPCDGDALIQRCIDDCRSVGVINRTDPVWTALQVDLPHAYVIYDHARAANVALIRSWLEQHDILLAGRYSEWEYYNSDHAFLAGKKAAELAHQRLHASRSIRTRA